MDNKTFRVKRTAPAAQMSFEDQNGKVVIFLTSEFGQFEELDVTIAPVINPHELLRAARRVAVLETIELMNTDGPSPDEASIIVDAIERVDAEFAAKETERGE